MLNWKKKEQSWDQQESYSAFINLNVDLSEFAIPPANYVGREPYYGARGKRSAFSHFMSFYLRKIPPERELCEWILSFSYNHFYVNTKEEGMEMAEQIVKKLREKILEQLS